MSTSATVVAEYHCFQALGLPMVLHVDRCLFYEVNNLTFHLLCTLRNRSMDDTILYLLRRYRKQDIDSAIDNLWREDFFSETPWPRPQPETVKRPFSTLELCVTHGCNLACRYCYGARGHSECESGVLYGAQSGPMARETAMRGVDFLYANSGRLKTINIVFFGGEPFLNFALMKEVTAYCREKARQNGKSFDLSVVTNGTLFGEEQVRFVNENRIGVQISIDGPPDIHNANRPYRDGSGSYGAVASTLALLRKSGRRHVPARTSAASGNADTMRTFLHLLEMGFTSVHIEPCLAQSGDAAMTPADVDALIAQEEEIAAHFVKQIRAGHYLNYHGLVRHVRGTRVVHERRYHYCGAGRGLICLSNEGDFYPCHRFLGMKEFRIGNLDAGIDDSKREPFRTLHVDARPACRDCWARYFCGGGCWSHAVGANGTLETPDEEYSCRLIRRQIELAMAINASLRVSDRAIVQGIYESETLPYLKE